MHRLDRYTSGVILVARSDAAHRNLADSSRPGREEDLRRTGTRAREERSGRVNTPIARDPVRRVRMTARLAHGRQAITSYRVIRRFEELTFLEVKIGTGRTHQIRVHLASIGHPVMGDKLYGAPAGAFGRYFLHARQITFTSPGTGEQITVSAPLPAELETQLAALE